ncbi:MAG: sodium:proton antiporter [Bacteroidaceae bacterium]|nr:sodium:proton antiporter [Bacteroidaceae bacterium]
MEKERRQKAMHPLVGLVPIFTLLAFIIISLWVFDGDISGGGSQLSMMFATVVSLAISIGVYRYRWKDYVEVMAKLMGNTAESIAIVLLIGMLAASWMLCGAVPTLIYYGVDIVSPSLFLFTSCVLCSIVSLVTGSSWSCVATIGVALYGIGSALGVPSGWTAGAILSGAYFGDKMSPLSDTTVLASSSTGTELFTHVRNMLTTTIPSMSIALIVFLIAGFGLSKGSDMGSMSQVKQLGEQFNVSLLTLIVPAATLVMIIKRVPALVTLISSSILAGIMAVLLQPEMVCSLAGDSEVTAHGLLKGVFLSYVSGTHYSLGSEFLDNLTKTNGMMGMSNTVWLILFALFFGASLVYCGMLQAAMKALTRKIKGRVALVTSTVFTGIGFNLTTSDQFTSIILLGSLYKDTYEREGLETKLLSRTIEDSTTITSVLIPWNSCGMTQSAVLGIATFDYLPYCVFNYVSPFMTILVSAMFGKKK